MTDTTETDQPTSPESISDELFRAGRRVTYVGIAANIVLIALKFIGGIVGTSSALIADAFHSISDLLTDAGVLLGLKYIAKPADSTHAYGHGRVETAISLLMGIAIVGTGLGLMRGGFTEMSHAFRGEFPKSPGIIALVMGVISIVSKEAMFHYTKFVARASGSRTLEANAWHHRSDALSSVGTVAGVGGAIILGSRWTILDPAAAVFVSILVIKVGFDIGLTSFRELTDESISHKDRKAIVGTIMSIDGVMGCHKLRTRRLGRYVTVDAHVQVDPLISVRAGHDIATEVEKAVRASHPDVAFVTIHIEPGSEAGLSSDLKE